MKAHEIREAFLVFFSKKDHKVVKSSPLLPKDDPTILFTNAGMNQFKNIFLGLETRSYKRAVSVQKCMRVSGKHNDLETVGRTAKHHTFFEMLGNFSFGDYFKEEAIAFAWELVTEVFKLPRAGLYVTIYEEDDAAHDIWSGGIGVAEGRIFRFGKKDNYWAMGETGPCGPCSEIHFDLGEGLEPGDPYALIASGSDRFLELWNLVFMENYQDEKGILHPLPSPSIDTGMGLERTAAVLQGKTSNFETDLFMPLIESVCELSRREYPAEDEGDISVRIIADHIRAITFLIGDGVTPANLGRGYVLRRLIRRAHRHGNLLGIDKPFLHDLVGDVSDIMKDAYPELLASAHYISRLCLSEEERFAATLDSGLRYFDQYAGETLREGKSVIPGDKLFKLYDTFGFPLDLSQELAGEQKLGIDELGFQACLEGQKQKARLSWKGDQLQREKKIFEEMKDLKVRSLAYEAAEIPETEVLAIVRDGQRADSLDQGQAGEIVLAETPFYAEAGGQVGDAGIIKGPRCSALIKSAYYLTPEIVGHETEVVSGRLSVGDKVEATVDLSRRKAISNNHTATHLLHAALRQVLGDHVKQAGSLVSPARLRFDFTHYAALSKEEIRKIEFIVNEKIREDLAVRTRLTSLEEGIAEGAMAIFEEKYGEKVRLVGIDDFSRELCGGIHVESTGQIGLFKILTEASIAAGMRRIEALTGEEAFRYIEELDDLVRSVELSLSASRKDILVRIDRLKDSLEKAEKESRVLRQKLAQAGTRDDVVQDIGGIKVLTRRAEGIGPSELRDLADQLKQKMGSGVVVLGSVDGGKVSLVISVSADLAGRIKAGALIKEIAPIIGGGGGGRADFAQAGGTRPLELESAFHKVREILEKTPKGPGQNHP